MLDALLGEGAVSDEAVRDWAAAVDIDALDAASYRLIPALCARCRFQSSAPAASWTDERHLPLLFLP